MTCYEILAIIISGFAIIISVFTAFKQNQLQRESNELQRNQSELSAMQSNILRNQQSKALCQIELIKAQGVKYEFKVSNISQVNANNVTLEFKLGDEQSDPVNWQKYKGIFPVKTLSPTQSVSVYTHRDLNSPPTYTVISSWTNPDKSTDSIEVTLIPN